MHQAGRALLPALRVKVCPSVAALGTPVQSVGVSGILCVLAHIMEHTDNLTGYRVCQLANCRTVWPCWQSNHKSLLPAAPFGMLPERPVRPEF